MNIDDINEVHRNVNLLHMTDPYEHLPTEEIRTEFFRILLDMMDYLDEFTFDKTPVWSTNDIEYISKLEERLWFLLAHQRAALRVKSGSVLGAAALSQVIAPDPTPRKDQIPSRPPRMVSSVFSLYNRMSLAQRQALADKIKANLQRILIMQDPELVSAAARWIEILDHDIRDRDTMFHPSDILMLHVLVDEKPPEKQKKLKPWKEIIRHIGYGSHDNSVRYNELDVLKKGPTP